MRLRDKAAPGIVLVVVLVVEIRTSTATADDEDRADALRTIPAAQRPAAQASSCSISSGVLPPKPSDAIVRFASPA
jgi:hypothetical protein